MSCTNCVIVMPSLCLRYAVVMHSLAVVVNSLCHHNAVVTQSLCLRCFFAMPSLCTRYAIVMVVASSLWRRCAILMSLSRRRRWSQRNFSENRNIQGNQCKYMLNKILGLRSKKYFSCLPTWRCRPRTSLRY